MMEELGIEAHKCHLHGTVVHVAVDGKYEGHVVISDRIKEDALAIVPQLHSEGVSMVFMLTGDSEKNAAPVCEKTGITDYRCSLTPEGKLEEMELIMSSAKGAIFWCSTPRHAASTSE